MQVGIWRTSSAAATPMRDPQVCNTDPEPQVLSCSWHCTFLALSKVDLHSRPGTFLTGRNCEFLISGPKSDFWTFSLDLHQIYDIGKAACNGNMTVARDRSDCAIRSHLIFVADYEPWRNGEAMPRMGAFSLATDMAWQGQCLRVDRPLKEDLRQMHASIWISHAVIRCPLSCEHFFNC